MKDSKEITVVDPEVVTPKPTSGQIPKNIPYTKIFNSEGDLVNPITKANPYLNNFMNRKDRRSMFKRFRALNLNRARI
jgi:hypothetical protein